MTKSNKLVRDNIPAICEAAGVRAITRILIDDTEYLAALNDKSIEEAEEFKQDPGVSELVDELEVIHAKAALLGIPMEALEAARAHKAAERGGFGERIFLIRTEPITE